MKTSWMKIKIFGAVLSILVFIFMGIVFFVPEGDYLIPFENASAQSVSREFLRALVDHQEARLKSLSTASLLPKIDQWLNDHQEVACEGPLWWEPQNSPAFTSEIISKETNLQRIHLVLSIECDKQKVFYCIRVSDLSLILTDEGWLVEDWAHLNEQLLSLSATCHVE